MKVDLNVVLRAELINGCKIVYVQSIGGQAAAKAVRVNVHPVKMPEGGLAKILGVEVKSLNRFAEMEEEIVLKTLNQIANVSQMT